MPRLTASSASSRGVQVLTGRSADVGVSHESRHNLHKLLEREGRGRSGTLLIRQQGFDGLTEQVPLACLFDRLQAWLSCVPAITPPPRRFIAARCENGPGRRHCARVQQRWSGPRGRSLHLRPASSRADDLPRPLLRLFVELGVMETPA
jgi:hypothetical protein